jgi:DNA-binding response OmpR family regulator
MNKISILIIEDEIDLRCSVAAFFEDLGYQIFEAGNGREGLELFLYELFLLDNNKECY